ncbi:MAG: transposase, partial [Oscillospiraceae bacterium]|nr:transposase [Oscillospiraceae bacterium]
LITAIGVSYLLQSLAQIIFGAAPKFVNVANLGYLVIGELQIGYHTIITLLVTVAVMIALTLFINLTKTGKIAEEQLLFLEKEYPFVKIDKYVIMPNHIHIIFALTEKTAGASPRPTLSDIVCAYKSRTTRLCNKINCSPGKKIFQTSFYDEIIRNQKAYDEISEYVYENPVKWEEDELYCSIPLQNNSINIKETQK